MVGTATSPDGRGAAWDHLRTAIDTDREARHDGTNETTHRQDSVSVLVSVGGSCPHIAEEAEAHDGEDRHDEDFHDRSLLGPGVVTVDDSHHPSAVAAAYT